MKRHRGVLPLAAGLLASLTVLAGTASAGEIAIEGQAGYYRMAASNSAAAVFGSDNGATYGGALRETFWRGAFVAAGARTFSKTGERVFVATPFSPVQRLGFPLTMRTTSMFLTAGYRFRRGKLVVPYVSAGGAITRYKETSDVTGEPFDLDVSKAGFAGAVGVELGRGLLRFAAEGGWSTAPNAIGTVGVAKVYGESDAGGKYAVAKIVLTFGDGFGPR